MSRDRKLEFSDKTKDQAAQRAAGTCERCGLRLKARPEFHHILEVAFKGGNSLANCLVVCTPCHVELSNAGIKKIRKADHVRRANTVKPTPERPIAQRPTPEKPKKARLPPLRLYKEKDHE